MHNKTYPPAFANAAADRIANRCRQKKNKMSMIASLLRVSGDKLKEFQKNCKLLEGEIYPEANDENPFIEDFDKSWEAIIYLLTGKNFEQATEEIVRIFFSGNLINDDQDLGYGPAHFLISREVKELNHKLSLITNESIQERFNPVEMNNLGVYPGNWREEDWEYLKGYFEKLKKFYSVASKNNEAVISTIN